MTERKKKVSVPELQQMKRDGKKISMLSVYDYPTAMIADRMGLDMILIGDSLAQTVLGQKSTVTVTMEEMLHHAKAVTRATPHTFVVGDMPFMSANTGERDLIINAGRYMREGGTDAVKVEGIGDVVGLVSAIHNAGMPVMAHLGLTPQNMSILGGPKVQGKDAKTAQKIIDDSLRLQDAGAFGIILECVPDQISKIITERLEIPVISYGAGPYCDGHGMVSSDLLGFSDGPIPRFSRTYVKLHEIIGKAFGDYIRDVQSGNYPSDKESYHIDEKELSKLLGN
jgi:3-methyl-2-oxobutanoate hydroxymethyltransferase